MNGSDLRDVLKVEIERYLKARNKKLQLTAYEIAQLLVRIVEGIEELDEY